MNFSGFPFNGFGMPQGMNNFFNPQANPPQGFNAAGFSSGSNSYSVSQHNCHKRVREPLDSLSLGGHNNRIEIASTVDSIMVQGHNNKVYGNG